MMSAHISSDGFRSIDLHWILTKLISQVYRLVMELEESTKFIGSVELNDVIRSVWMKFRNSSSDPGWDQEIFPGLWDENHMQTVICELTSLI